MKLDSSVALITGSARRVGREIAIELARAGCDIAIHYHRSKDDAESLAGVIEKMGRKSVMVDADLVDSANWPAIVRRAVDTLGRLDILVNNASTFERMSLDEFEPAAWDRTFRVNLTAIAGLAHHAAPHLRRFGCGKIVNLADIAAARPWKSHLAYCTSKAGVVSLTRSLALSLAPDVQVNAVAPGIAEFPEDYDDVLRRALIEKVPLKRAGTVRDIAAAVRFLCEHGDYITGQVLNVDGGRSIA